MSAEPHLIATYPTPGASPAPEGMTICVHSGEIDRFLAALTVANGVALMGAPARVFFTFWGTLTLPTAPRGDGPWWRRWLMRIIPFPGRCFGLSRFGFFGLGTRAMRWRMASLRFPDVAEQLTLARELGVELYVCDTSLAMMGLTMDDFDPRLGLVACGVTTYVDRVMSSQHSLFV